GDESAPDPFHLNGIKRNSIKKHREEQDAELYLQVADPFFNIRSIEERKRMEQIERQEKKKKGTLFFRAEFFTEIPLDEPVNDQESNENGYAGFKRKPEGNKNGQIKSNVTVNLFA
ncbi:MAG: hypothetical protein ACJ76F_09530, partial [Bacteroidia bacterium]